MSATPVQLPPGLTQSQIDALRALNPGVPTYTVAPLAPGQTPAADVHRERLAGWCDVLNGALDAGAHLVLPGPLGSLLGSALHAGAEALESLLLKAPVTERFTLADIQAHIDSLPVASA